MGHESAKFIAAGSQMLPMTEKVHLKRELLYPYTLANNQKSHWRNLAGRFLAGNLAF